jgi:hypothetical protein
MKKFALWLLAFVITAGAAYYQRKTGPTYPKQIDITVNDSVFTMKLVRSLSLNERPEVKLRLSDTTIKARLFYRRFRSEDKYMVNGFVYKVYPLNSFIMNKIFKIYEEKGFFAAVPQQPPAGKLEYYIEITDSDSTDTYLKESPVVIRFKGSVPGIILVPHVILMFAAMLFSTFAGLSGIARLPSYRKYSICTLALLSTGGLFLGPLVQYHAFGELWTGIPLGWDLTDNKTIISLTFWILAVIMNRKKERPLFTVLAAVVLLLVYSIPHSMFGSEFDYESGKVIQGILLIFPHRFIENYQIKCSI